MNVSGAFRIDADTNVKHRGHTSLNGDDPVGRFMNPGHDARVEWSSLVLDRLLHRPEELASHSIELTRSFYSKAIIMEYRRIICMTGVEKGIQIPVVAVGI